jgi:hypothetical protein
MGLTHLLRREVHRRRSPNAPTSRMWPMFSVWALLISIVLTALVIGVNEVFSP